MRISKFLLSFSIIEIVFVIYALFYLDNSIATSSDISIVILISIVFLLTNNYFFKKNPFVAFILYYIFNISYLLPFCFILYFPEYANVIISKYTNTQESFHLVFLLLLITLCLSFYILRDITFKSRVLLNVNSFFNKKMIIFIFITLILNFIFSFFNILPVFSIFFNPQLCFSLLIFYSCIPFKDKSNSKYIYLFLFLFIFYTILFGSRSGLYYLVIYYLVCFLYINGDIYINKKYYLLFFLVILSSLVAYPIATVFRIANDQNVNFDLSLFFTTDTDEALSLLFAKIIQRLSLLDYTYIIANNLYKQSFFDNYFTFENFIYSFINITFPYSISNTLVSNNLLANLTFDYNIEDIRGNWSSGNAFIVDFNHLYFPGFGLPISLLFFYLYKKIMLMINNNYTLFSLLYVILFLKIFDLYVFFGYDYFFRNLFHAFISLLVLFLVNLIIKSFVNYESKS